MVEEIRDDGKITLVLGNDGTRPARPFDPPGPPELGRINAGNMVQAGIVVMVRQDARCGAQAVAEAMVTTRRNDVQWPPVVAHEANEGLSIASTESQAIRDVAGHLCARRRVSRG